jgi:hypothetical protein
MADKKSYKEKLLDPRWQKRRLEILSKDNFRCCHCGNATETLHVHHVIYISGRDPWDCPDDHLWTVCEQCHNNDHSLRESSEIRLIKALKLNGFDHENINELILLIESNNRITRSMSSLIGKLTFLTVMPAEETIKIGDLVYENYSKSQVNNV